MNNTLTDSKSNHNGTINHKQSLSMNVTIAQNSIQDNPDGKGGQSPQKS